MSGRPQGGTGGCPGPWLAEQTLSCCCCCISGWADAGSGKEGGARQSAGGAAHSALYGAINGIVAVPAMVSFVAIIYQVCISVSGNLFISAG